MNKVLLVAFLLLALSLVTVPKVSSQMEVKTTTSVPSKSFTIIVSRHGFNGTNAPLILNLTRGDIVHITFLYGDNELSYDNPHVIFLQGYDLRTGVISKWNPSATLDFIANESGVFTFYCVVPCDGMLNLNSGRIVVEQPSTGALPTTINLMVDGTAVQGQPTRIMATLAHGSQPVPNERLEFYENTTYGPMKIGTAVTDSNGVARIVYTFASGGDHRVIAKFVGSELLGANSTQFTFSVEPRSEGEPILVRMLPEISGGSLSGLPYVRGQNRMPDVRLVGVPLPQGVPLVTLILLVVGSVWATYGYVFAQVRAIKRGSPKESIEEKAGGERKLESTSKKGFDKRILLGALLVVVVVAGFFAYYQFAAVPQAKTETIKIDIKMLMESGGERHVFDPATITVHKGDHIVLIVTNTDDDSIHGIIIPELNLNTGPLKGDEQAKLEFDANTTGTFTILCPVPGCAPDHDQMIGQLVVVA